MSHLFLALVRSALSASILILLVLLLRFCFRKMPKWICGILWMMVALRLMLPFSLESRYSLMPRSVSDGTLVEEWTERYTGDVTVLYEDDPRYAESLQQGLEPSTDAFGRPYITANSDGSGAAKTVREQWVPLLSCLWAAGTAVLFLYLVISTGKLRKKVSEAAGIQENVYLCDAVSSPFILGILRPRIYLPSRLTERESDFILAHEQAHIRRGDHLWKPLGFVLLSIYWFHPLLWVCYALLCKDIEVACDERVIRNYTSEQKSNYAETLLRFGTTESRITACPLAFGETGIKERVSAILSYKKPAFWILCAALVLCVVVGIGFLTNPAPSSSVFWEKSTYRFGDSVYSDGAISYVENQNNAPVYSFDGNRLYTSLSLSGNLASSTWEEVGPLEPIRLTKDTFDAAFSGYVWSGFSGAADLRKHVRSSYVAEKLVPRTVDHPYDLLYRFFLLQLNDSRIVLCRGVETDGVFHVLFAYTLVKNPEIHSSGISAHSDIPDISLLVTSQNLLGDFPRLTVLWINHGTTDFTFGPEYCIYTQKGDRWDPVPPQAKFQTDYVHTLLKPDGRAETTYTLSHFPLEEGRQYRLFLNGWGPTHVWIEFTMPVSYEPKTTGIYDAVVPPPLSVTSPSGTVTAHLGSYDWVVLDYEAMQKMHNVSEALDLPGYAENGTLALLTIKDSPVSRIAPNECVLDFGGWEPDRIIISRFDGNGVPEQIYSGPNTVLSVPEGLHYYSVQAEFQESKVEYFFASQYLHFTF